MKCRGSGKGIHEHATVDEVRQCYGVKKEAWDKIPQTTPPPHPTAEDLRISELKARLPKIHRPKISVPQSAHDELKKEPGDDIPAGYYATPSLTGNNDLDFWKVEKGKGRWADYTFISRVIGGRDDADIPRDSKKRVQVEWMRDRVTQAKALRAILDYGVVESNERFGVELKYCRECGIHLTDELSRDLGIGPVCRGKP